MKGGQPSGWPFFVPENKCLEGVDTFSKVYILVFSFD